MTDTQVDERRLVFAEDLDGIWHVRRDDFWDNDASADVRAHAVCGDIWSCHVSEFPPSLMEDGHRERHCRTCFRPAPLRRKRAAA